MPEKKKMIMVRTDKGCFISDCFATDGFYYNYHRTEIKDLLFNGKKATDTYYRNWYYIEEFPTLIQIERDGKITNERYELKDKSLASENLPEVIPYDEKDSYSCDIIECLYCFQGDREPSYLEEVPYDIEVVCEVDNYNFPPKVDYKGIKKIGYSDGVYTIKNVDINHQLLDKIIFPEVLLHERPCKFTSKQMYDITRQYILEHINSSVAKITSNYDFCFEVRKLIPFIEPETISYQNIFAKTGRERNKIRTKVKKYEEKTIFSMTDDRQKYKSYPIIPEMYANSEAELKDKVDTWLEGLISIINEPLCQCPQCKGTGYINEIKREGFSYNN